MLVRKIAAVLLTLTILGIGAVHAYADDGQQKDKSLFGRIDSLGKSIFGGILPAGKSKEAASPKSDSSASRSKSPIVKPSAQVTPSKDPLARDRAAYTTVARETPAAKPERREPIEDMDIPAGPPRAGSVLSGSSAFHTTVVDNEVDESEELMPENTPPAVSRSVDVAPQPAFQPPADAPMLLSDTPMPGEAEATEEMTQQAPVAPMYSVTRDQSGPISELADIPLAAKPPAKPLHERLSSVRRSAFSKDSPAETAQPSSPRPDRSQPKSENEAVVSKSSPRPLIAQRNTPELNVRKPEAAELPPAEALPKEPGRASHAEAAVPSAEASNEATPDSAGLLFRRKGPILSVETLGPRRITVGKESTYEVNLTNSGEVAAEELVVFVALPEWAEVAAADVSSGSAKPGTGPAAGTVQWDVGHLDAKGSERLALKIVPRQNRPFDLSVRWESKPVGSQAMIEVQEPKLVLQLDGPREVLYGKKEVYRLKLSNSGNGNAENVTLLMIPVGGGENVAATHKLGVLAAGEEKVLEVELTARQTGSLTVQVDANADGGVHTELSEKVAVRRANLKMDVEGPKMQFVGATGSYTLRVCNSGTAPARNINLSVILPAGAKYLSGIDDAKVDETSGKLSWTIPSLNPEVEQAFVLKASLGAAGVCRVQAKVTADDDLSTAGETTTQVEAVASLTLDVKDPDGPTPIGQEARYEVRIRNRGTRAAEGVEIFGYFSRGIEPTAADGRPSQLGPGQVVFQPITSLAAGEEIVLTVRAKAETAGNHVFRAEAHCKPLGTRLIREATNLYYSDAPGSLQASRQPAVDRPAAEPVRTVNRPVQAEQTVAPARK